MADVGLDGRQGAELVGGQAFAALRRDSGKGAGQSIDLDGIAQRGAGTMGFDVADR